MPPVSSENEMSDVSVGDVTTPPPRAPAKKGRPYMGTGPASSDESVTNKLEAKENSRRSVERAKIATHRNGAALTADKNTGNESDGDETDVSGEGEETGEEFEVEKIIEHVVDVSSISISTDEIKHGVPLFHVKWKGYDDPEDYTWEPEDNLAENASEILGDYIFTIGGREKLLERPVKGKKRGRPSSTATAVTPTKRSRKGTDHPADRESPSEVPKTFKPPAGSWEEEVVDVEMFRDEQEGLRVCLTWKSGGKSQHSAQQAYLRCPQKILRFYESHISFKTTS